MMWPYSKCCLTKLVNKVLNLSVSIYSKDHLISPKILFAFLDTLSMCDRNFNSLSMYTPFHIQLIQV